MIRIGKNNPCAPSIACVDAMQGKKDNINTIIE